VRTCPACGAGSPDGIAFCRECGSALATPCSSCGAPDERGRFCGTCGTALREPAAGSAVFSPQKATEPVAAPVAERRMTSVLFADLVGFTPLSEARDPEEVREILSVYFTRCREVIGRFDGVVEKFIGDAVMAVWGVPTAHEDDAERAVRAGLDLAAMVTALGVELDAPLALRVGIVTGEVAVTVGATAEGMVAGDAVNTAARVQSAATPGQVWVNDATRSLTEGVAAFEDVGLHELKGKADSLHLWHADHVLDESGAREVREGSTTPLVGREEELGRLTALFGRVHDTGRPRAVVVEGEAGIGKSRLVREFEGYADQLDAAVRWHRGRCLSYGDGMAFRALAEAIRARLGVIETDAVDAVAQALDAALDRYVPDVRDRTWLRPRLGVLLGTTEGVSFARGDLFASWTAFLEHVAHDGDALVLVIDDAHHADDGLVDFLEHLLATARSAILVVLVARPDLLARRPDLELRAEVVHLAPLPDDDMTRILTGLVSGLPHETRDELVQRAEGIPLFAVETVRALVDQGRLIRDGDEVRSAEGAVIDVAALGAPVTLQALVAARLDALTPAEKRVIADASVLGKSFTVDGLVSLGTPSADLEELLPSLQRKEILALQTDRFSAEREQYRFVQAVVRQVAYSMQSRRDRKARHVKVADHLATLPDPSDDLAVVTAQHLLDAVDEALGRDPDVAALTARACACLERAGARARSLGAPSDAERLLSTALERTTDRSGVNRLTLAVATAANEAGLYTVAADMAADATTRYEADGDLVQAGCAAAEQVVALVSLGDNATAVSVGRPWWERLDGVEAAEPALNLLARNLASASLALGDVASQRRFVERRLEIARSIGDQRALASASIQLGLHFMHVGEPDKAQSMLEWGAAIAREHDVPDSLAYALQVLGSSTKSRDLVAAVAFSEEAVVAARRTGRPLYVDYAVGNLVQALWSVARLGDSRLHLAELASTATEPIVRTWIPALDLWLADADGREPMPVAGEPVTDSETVQSWVGSARVMRALRIGDLAAASLLAEETLGHVVEAMGLDDDFIVLWPPLVRAAVAAGDVERATRLLAPVAEARQESVTPGVHAHWHVLRGLVGAVGGAPEVEVEGDLRIGIDALDRFGAVGAAARGAEDLGRWLLLRGRHDEARTYLANARETYRALGADGWLDHLRRWSNDAGLVDFRQ